MKLANDRCPFCTGPASSSTCLNASCAITTFEAGEDCYPHAARVKGTTKDGATVVRWLIRPRHEREEVDMVTTSESGGDDA
jgi:hypothetical protein